MGANRPWGESSQIHNHLDVGESSMGRIDQGESSMVRIDHGANRPAFGRNVHGAKRTVGETSGNLILTDPLCNILNSYSALSGQYNTVRALLTLD